MIRPAVAEACAIITAIALVVLVRWGVATVDDLPRGTYDALNNNQMIKKAALDRAERDDAWASKWGVTRKDVQTMRRVIGEAKGGWIDALKQAVKAGVVLPAVAMAYVAAGQQGDG